VSGEPVTRDLTTSAWRWTLMLPPGWATLPTESAAGRAAVKRLLDKRMAHLPRDQVAATRIELDRTLRGVLSDARDAGASELHALVDLVRGLPVSASVAVTVVPLGEGLDPAALAQALAGGEDVVESDGRLLGDLPALRRRRCSRGPMSVAGSAPVPVTRTTVEWFVPSPDGDEGLLLSFSTMTEPVVEELVLLFDAIAGSLDVRPA
jgi:hypothetical protein